MCLIDVNCLLAILLAITLDGYLHLQRARTLRVPPFLKPANGDATVSVSLQLALVITLYAVYSPDLRRCGDISMIITRTKSSTLKGPALAGDGLMSPDLRSNF